MITVGYLRKSRVLHGHAGALSWETQESEIRALAARSGDVDLTILSDWGRSGRGPKTRLRSDFLQLRDMITNGQVATIYSYSLSRLARSLSDYVALAELCQEHGVRIVLCKEGTLDYATVSGRLLVHILAAAAQAEAEWAQERAQDAIRLRKDRGDYLGLPPFGFRVEHGKLVENPAEDVSRVVAAFEQAGSVLGATKALNSSDVRSKRGIWTPSGVRGVLERAGVYTPTRQGVKHRQSFKFAQLLRCPFDGHPLTGQHERWPRYFCGIGTRDPRHARPYSVSERNVEPWIRTEIGRLRTPDRVLAAEADDQTRVELTARRDRLIESYIEGLIDRPSRDQRLQVVDQQLAKLDATGRRVAIPEIDWTWPIGELNVVLRSVIHHVELDEQMRPIRAEWLVPEWRAS